MSRALLVTGLFFSVVGRSACLADLRTTLSGQGERLRWSEDYGAAMKQAKCERKMMFLFFYDKPASPTVRQLEAAISSDPVVRRDLEKYVPVKLPVKTTVIVQGQPLRLLDHGAFAEMKHCPGIAVIDLTDPKSDQYGYVVSVYPFCHHRTLDRHRLAVLLELPRGSLTQRTLIFAVRMHPEHPRSADGQLVPLLADETRKHCMYQASTWVQGHQNWSERFQRIQSRIRAMSTAQEVCAESWPGQDLVGAAIECVHSWRQSPGHWSAVRSPAKFFGYDMKKGRNGVWYATGIFVR